MPVVFFVRLIDKPQRTQEKIIDATGSNLLDLINDLPIFVCGYYKYQQHK